MPLGAVKHQVQCQYGDSASERFSEPHRGHMLFRSISVKGKSTD